MKKYSVTFYDIIGYLVPGLLLTLILATTTSALFDNRILLQKVYSLKWPWHLALGYVGGHIVQAITNIAFPFNVSTWWRDNKWDPDLKKKILSLLQETIFHNNKSEMTLNSVIVQLAEGTITLDHQIDKADTFRALQGFFRAMSGVFALATIISCLFFFSRIPFTFYISQTKLTFPPHLMGLFALLCGACALLFYYRFRRFAEYRLRTIFLSYYVCAKKNKKSFVDNDGC